MSNMTYLDLLLNDPEQALGVLLHRGTSGPLLLIAAGLLGSVGAGLAAQAYFRGKSVRFSWGRLGANVGGLAWLLPVAAVFALYGVWMRPSLSTPGDARPDVIAVRANYRRNTPVESGTSLPDWVQEKESLAGNSKVVVVTGEIGATVEEATAAARTAAVELARDDFAASFPQVVGWKPQAISDAMIRRTFVEEIDRKTLSSGVPFRVYRAYDQVELSPRVRRSLFLDWKSTVVERRMWALGGLAGLLTLTFATVAAYFRLDDRTSGLNRRRLKLAAVCVIAAGGFAAATLL